MSHGKLAGRLIGVGLAALVIPLLCGFGLEISGYQVHTTPVPTDTQSIDTQTDLTTSEHGYVWLCRANWGPAPSWGWGAGRHETPAVRSKTYSRCLAATRAGTYGQTFSAYIWSGPIPGHGDDCVTILALKGDHMYCRDMYETVIQTD